MKPPALVHVTWTLIALIAFIVGTFTTDTPQPHSPVAAAKGNVSAGAVQTTMGSPGDGFVPLGGKLLSDTALNAEEAGARAFEVLSEPNRVKRMGQLSELLKQVSKENWKVILDAFVNQTIHEGRTHDQEWFLMLERIGEVAGSEAIADTLNSTVAARTPWLLIGWANAAPDQALAWLQSQPPEVQTQMLHPVINGIARANPKQALELMMQQPLPIQDRMLGVVVDAAIQRGGYAEAEGLLKPLIGRSDIQDGTRGKLFYDIARRKMNSARLNGNPFEALDWFEGYLGEGSPAGAAATQDLINSTAAVDAEATLQWLEDRADRFGPYKSAAAYPAVARILQAQAPEKFTAWMDAHPDHPQRDLMAVTAANSLLQRQKVEDAKRLGATVRDEKLRIEIEKAFLKYSKPNQQPER